MKGFTVPTGTLSLKVIGNVFQQCSITHCELKKEPFL